VLICQDCGRENPDEFKFCSKCGKELIKPLPLGDSKLKVHRDRIREIILQRKSTDTVISPIWVILLVAIILVMTLAAIGMIIAAAVDLVRDYPSGDFPYPELMDRAEPAILTLTLQVIIYGTSLSLITYLLVARLRNHIKRENALNTSIAELLASAAGSDNRRKMLEDAHPTMSSTDTVPWQLGYPIVWALVPLIPILAAIFQHWYIDTHEILQRSDLNRGTYLTYPFTILTIALEAYMFYFLGKSISEHDGHSSMFAQDSRLAMNDLGFPHGRSFDVGTIAYRSFWLYFVLSVITLGLWTYYWWYTLVKDPNIHFTKQWDFEDNVLDSIDKAEEKLSPIT